MTETPATPRPLTWRERKVLAFLRDYTAEHGYPPVVREIGDACGLSSTSSVSYVLRCLTAKGHISRVPDKQRAVVVRRSGVPPLDRQFREDLALVLAAAAVGAAWDGENARQLALAWDRLNGAVQEPAR